MSRITSIHGDLADGPGASAQPLEYRPPGRITKRIESSLSKECSRGAIKMILEQF